MNGVKRILLCVPETAGDVMIATGLLPGIKSKWPDANLYFATQKKYFDILRGNQNVTRVIEYHKSMLNYRNFETWGPQQNTFDVVYHPTIVTQHIPHWIHGGHGDYLGHVYAHMCDLDRGEYGPQFLAVERDESVDLPAEYLTVHSKTNQDPKDYDNMQRVVDGIGGIPVVQVGGRDDPLLRGVALDLRGKTSPQSLAWVIKGAYLHLGLDSFPMHVAMYVDTPSVILFGGTYAKQGVWPAKKHLVTALEPEDRFACVTSCHLIECEMKKAGFGKCIDNVQVDRVIEAIELRIGPGKVTRQEPVKMSAYMILRDGVKYGFPFRASIEAAAKIADEVVVVDGGSTDGTIESLKLMASNLPNLIVHQVQWDMDNPTLFGDEKTRARRLCSGTHLIQLDADEVIHEPEPGAFRRLVAANRDADVLDLPVISFYGDPSVVRLEQVPWKWRVSRRDPNIVHGVHREARLMNESGRVTMDKRVSDSCEYLYSDTLSIARHKVVFPIEYLRRHKEAVEDEGKRTLYSEYLKELVASNCLVFHYSWVDLGRKASNGSFWDETWHGKRGATHNTTVDVESRVRSARDMLVRIDFQHPMMEVRPSQLPVDKPAKVT